VSKIQGDGDNRGGKSSFAVPRGGIRADEPSSKSLDKTTLNSRSRRKREGRRRLRQGVSSQEKKLGRKAGTSHCGWLPGKPPKI